LNHWTGESYMVNTAVVILFCRLVSKSTLDPPPPPGNHVTDLAERLLGEVLLFEC
jgi:hypothetical protein